MRHLIAEVEEARAIFQAIAEKRQLGLQIHLPFKIELMIEQFMARTAPKEEHDDA